MATTTPLLKDQPTTLPTIATLSRWLPLAMILILAVVLRAGYIQGYGYRNDVEYYREWSSTIQNRGLFSLYRYQEGRLYPPVYSWILGGIALTRSLLIPGVDTLDNPTLTFIVKFPQLLAELVLITVAYFWLSHRRILKWAVPLFLAVNPVMIFTTVWWGQVDSLFTLFVVLSMIALNKDRPLWAWVSLALALGLKQQAVIAVPLIAVICFSRYGWRKTFYGAALCAAIFAFLLIPFLIGSGFLKGISPYYEGAEDVYPAVSLHALNFWYLVAPLSWGLVLQNWQPDDLYFDYLPAVGPISYKHVGFALIGIWGLLVCYSIWKKPHQKEEFVWAAAFYYATFMLMTQMHERYLYAGAVLSVLAAAQDRRAWPVAIGAAFTASYNVMQVATPFRWLGLDLWIWGVQTWVALLNMTLLIHLTWIAITPIKAAFPPDSSLFLFTEGRGLGGKYILNRLGSLNRLASGLLVLAIGVTILSSNISSLKTAHWMATHIDGNTKIVVEKWAALTPEFAADWPNASGWRYDSIPAIENEPVSEWYLRGAHYIVIDERTQPGDFSQRIEGLVAQGATLAYESHEHSSLIARQAILWTFSPQVKLDLTFDNTLYCMGYNVIRQENGGLSLLMHWYTAAHSNAAYQMFVHILDEHGQVIGQADMALGKGVHPTNTWRQGEIIFETVDLPTDVIQKLRPPYKLRIGLYVLGDSHRATIRDRQGTASSDSVFITVP